MDTFYAGLAEIFEVDAGDIGPDFDLAAHNWDSLAVVSVIALIDECFGKLVEGAPLAKCATVAEIETLMTRAEAA